MSDANCRGVGLEQGLHTPSKQASKQETERRREGDEDGNRRSPFLLTQPGYVALCGHRCGCGSGMFRSVKFVDAASGYASYDPQRRAWPAAGVRHRGKKGRRRAHAQSHGIPQPWRPRLQLHQLRRDIAAEERRLRKAALSGFGQLSFVRG